jgi:membrane dipeptidase
MAPELGLTPLGRELLGRLEAAGILLDLSHAGRRTFREALAMSTRVPCATHTGCRALSDHPRNLDDDQLRALAAKGGVAGIYAMPFLVASGQQAAADFLRHLEHALDVCGEDHVGVGTDLSIAAPRDLEARRRALRLELEARRRSGIASAGENAEALHLLPDLPGPALFRGLGRLLEARGHGARRIAKVLGGNFMRVYREAWGQ